MRTENWLRSFTVTPPGTDLLPWTRKIRPDRKRSWKAQVFFARPRFLFVQNRIAPCPRTIHLQICIKKTATHRCKKHHGQGIACSGRDLDFADKTHCIHPSFETAARIPVCSRPVHPGQQRLWDCPSSERIAFPFRWRGFVDWCESPAANGLRKAAPSEICRQSLFTSIITAASWTFLKGQS